MTYARKRLHWQVAPFLLALLTSTGFLTGLSGCNQSTNPEESSGLVADKSNADESNPADSESTEESSQLEKMADKAQELGGQAYEKGKELGTEAIDKSKEVGTQTIESTKELGSKAIKKGKELGTSTYEKGIELKEALTLKGKELHEWTTNDLYTYARDLVIEHGDDINGAGEHVNELLDKIARDPNTELSTTSRVTRMAVLMVPIAGPTKRYADARKLYQSAEQGSDAAKIQEARRECLIAFAEAGLDIGTLGAAGARIDLVATGADHILTALKVSRKVNVLVGKDLKGLNDLLDAMLESEALRAGIDHALRIDYAELVPEKSVESEGEQADLQ